jgi:hypothetical protein
VCVGVKLAEASGAIRSAREDLCELLSYVCEALALHAAANSTGLGFLIDGQIQIRD